MSDVSISKTQLTGKQTAAVIISIVYALLNVIALATWLSGGGVFFYPGDLAASFVNITWLLAPLAYVGIALFILLRKPQVASWLILVPALSVITSIVFGISIGYATYFLPLISLMHFSPNEWSTDLLSGTEFIAVIVIAILLLVSKKEPKGVFTVPSNPPTSNSNAPTGKTNFCPSCGSPAGEGNFCAKCGNNLGNPAATVVPNATYTGTTTSTMAVVALILSFFIPIVGLILGYISRKDIDNSGGRLTGRGLATAAIILNWIWIAGIVIWIFAIASLASQY